MRYSFWVFLWDTSDIVYKLSFNKIRIFAPIEYFYPDFAPFVFGKMIGCEGKKIGD